MVTHQRLDTEMFADSAEWCPFEGYQSILLCGTYQLQEDTQPKSNTTDTPQIRLGHLRMYKLEISDNSSQLLLVHKLSMSGILDIKWCRTTVNDTMLFGLVNSVGELQIWKFINDEVEPVMLHALKLGENCLGLSLDWSNQNNGSNQRILASDSTGSISLYNITNSGVDRVQQWKAHDFEAWVCGFNYWNNDIIYTGGDDCRLSAWDMNTGVETPIFSKRFDAGVCSMQCNSYESNQNITAVGGYDEHLRVWDIRNWKRSLSETKLCGGIWRIKWDPFKGTHILTATMYNGFHIVDVSQIGATKLTRLSSPYSPLMRPCTTCSANISSLHSDGNLPVILEYKDGEHGSLGYGADWCYMNKNNDKSTNYKNSFIATCSFYDHSLHLWSYS